MQTPRFIKKGLLIGSFLVVGMPSFLFAQDSDKTGTLSVDLNHAVQQIPTIIFAIPNDDGSRQETGQVEVGAIDQTVTIDGAFVTNSDQQNVARGDTSNASLIGGKENVVSNAAESTIIGGRGNIITTLMSLIAGGSGNRISTGNRSTILGGMNNSIAGEVSTIIGGRGSRITGSNSTIVGVNTVVSGGNSFAAGSGVEVRAESSFVWNDGSRTFTVRQAHLFALKGANGVVIGKDKPSTGAALSIKGALRIQRDDAKNALIECISATAGTVKSVAAIYNEGQRNDNQTCPCLCNGTKWDPMLTTPQCINACEDRKPQPYTGADSPKCGPTFNTCLTGSVVTGTFSYVYGTLGLHTGYQGPSLDGANYQKTGGIANHWYWVCRNNDTNVSVTCEVNFSCQGTTPDKANICSYSSASANEQKKDDRELNQNINKVLTGTISNRCKNTTDTTPQTKAELDRQINTCNNGIGQNMKCEFYCPNGWHKETVNGVDGCYQNSCRYEPVASKKTRDGKGVTFDPKCLVYNESTNKSVTNNPYIQTAYGGSRTFSANFTCDYGERTYTESVILNCDKPGYYKRTEGNTDPYDDRCIQTRWEPKGDWYGCTAPTPQRYGCNASPSWGGWSTCNAGSQTRYCSTGYGNRTSCTSTSGTEYKDGACRADDGQGRRVLVSDDFCSGSAIRKYNQPCSKSCGGAPSCSASCSQSSQTQSCGDGCTNGSTTSCGCNNDGTKTCSNGSWGACNKSETNCGGSSGDGGGTSTYTYECGGPYADSMRCKVNKDGYCDVSAHCYTYKKGGGNYRGYAGCSFSINGNLISENGHCGNNLVLNEDWAGRCARTYRIYPSPGQTTLSYSISFPASNGQGDCAGRTKNTTHDILWPSN